MKRRYHMLRTRRAFSKRQFWSIEIPDKGSPCTEWQTYLAELEMLLSTVSPTVMKQARVKNSAYGMLAGKEGNTKERKAKGIRVLDDGTGKSGKDLENEVDGSFNDVDDGDHANYVSNFSKDEVSSTDGRATGSTEKFDLGNKKNEEKLTRTKSPQKSRSRSRRRRKFRSQEEMESGEKKFNHEQKESKDTNYKEEESLK